MTERPATPQLNIMVEVHEQSQVIGEFLDWLTHTKKYQLAEWTEWDEEEEVENWDQPIGAVFGIEPKRTHTVTHHHGPELVAANFSINRLLAEFFGIDYDEMERERQRLLEYVHDIQSQSVEGNSNV